MSQRLTVIVSLPRGADPDAQRLSDAIQQQLAALPTVDMAVLAHLYDLTPNGPGVKLLRELTGDLIVMSWLYPRAAYWTLDAHGIVGRMGHIAAPGDKTPQPDAKRTIWCIDLRASHDPAKFIGQVERIIDQTGRRAAQTPAAESTPAPTPAEESASRWYPVIDFTRCTNCLECLNFCLFGVYGLDRQDRIVVEQPAACRNGCPACSRICPEGAIMFPQHKDPAIAGDPAASAADLKLDLSQLFRGSSAEELAEAERRHHLAEHQREQPPARKPAGDAIDRLLDDVDRLDL